MKPLDALSQARVMVFSNWIEGVDCPCCGQFVKLYHRRLNRGMAWSLIQIYKYFQQEGCEEWLHVEHHLKRNPLASDFTKLAYWDVIEEYGGVRDDGSKRVGLWKITQLGKDFVEGKILLPSHVFLYNDTFHGLDQASMTTIEECLGKAFNFTELMRGI
jgi:hypothetical protein